MNSSKILGVLFACLLPNLLYSSDNNIDSARFDYYLRNPESLYRLYVATDLLKSFLDYQQIVLVSGSSSAPNPISYILNHSHPEVTSFLSIREKHPDWEFIDVLTEAGLSRPDSYLYNFTLDTASIRKLISPSERRVAPIRKLEPVLLKHLYDSQITTDQLFHDGLNALTALDECKNEQGNLPPLKTTIRST